MGEAPVAGAAADQADCSGVATGGAGEYAGAAAATEDFLTRDTNSSHYYGVFLIQYQLNVLQEFTNDRKAVIEAINYAASGAQRSFITRSNEKRKALQKLAAGAAPAGDGELAPAAIEALMARYTLEVAQFGSATANEDSSESGSAAATLASWPARPGATRAGAAAI